MPLSLSFEDISQGFKGSSHSCQWEHRVDAQIDGMVSSRPGRDTLWPCSCHHMVRGSGQSEMPGRATLLPSPGRLKQVSPLLFSSIISPKVTFHK